MFILVLMLNWRLATSMSVVPQSFPTLAACQEAGEDYVSHTGPGVFFQIKDYVCLKK